MPTGSCSEEEVTLTRVASSAGKRSIKLAEPQYFAYVITLPSGHLYVGSTGRGRERVEKHRYHLKANTHPNRQLQAAYDLSPDQEQWTYEVFPVESREAAYELEQEMLDKYDADPTVKSWLCNVSPNAVSGAQSGELNPRYGKPHSEESKALMSAVKLAANRRAENSKLYGTHRTDETKAKVRDGHNAKYPDVLADGVVYSSIHEAARETGISRSSLKLKLNRNDPGFGYVEKPMKRAVKLAMLSDIHLGHRHNSASEIIANLRSAVGDNPETAQLDAIFLAGDVFDTLLTLPNDAIAHIDGWIKTLLGLCSKYQIVLRVLEGTPSHDWEQSKRFIEINDTWHIGANVKYFKNLDIEYIPELDRTVLYIKDQQATTTESTLEQVRELLAAKSMEQVDIAIMHGQFEFQVPPQAHVPKHDSAAYLALTREFISIGHDHKFAQHGHIVAQGSFDRLAHGEEYPKGHIRVELPGDGSHKVTFVENTQAKKFVTVDLRKLDTRAAFEKLKDTVKDLPNGSKVRPMLDPGHALLQQQSLFIRTWPLLGWDRPKVEKVDALDKTVQEEQAMSYTAMTITKDNITELLMERVAQNAPDRRVLEACSTILPEVI